MARKIKMIAPFETLTGNLSGSQKLTYPTQNNSAWEAPDDKRSYATNYVPRYVGVQRSDGTIFFSVKKRTAVKNSPAQKRAQAVLAATKLYIDAIDRNETILVRLGAQYIYLIEQGVESGDPTSNKDFKAWLRGMIERILKTKVGEFTVPGPYPTGAQQIILGNPWIAGSVPASSKFVPSIPQSLVVKFWLQLALCGMYFYVDNNIGVSLYDRNNPSEGANSFDEFITPNTAIPNVLSLTLETIGSSTYVKYGASYLLKSDRTTYVTGGSVPNPNDKFYLADIAPS